MGWELSPQTPPPGLATTQIVPYDANIKLKDVNSKYFTMNIGFRHLI